MLRLKLSLSQSRDPQNTFMSAPKVGSLKTKAQGYKPKKNTLVGKDQYLDPDQGLHLDLQVEIVVNIKIE